jgi:hypothetical protein
MLSTKHTIMYCEELGLFLSDNNMAVNIKVGIKTVET